ncbi:PAS domain-containing sensor histidine kinase [Pseudocnuella soli]|uniref:PAS domain-containing sensor histidine kinase n=1 Tax=Pseudocnuella soli TaxID=2502779 RepID=UPI00104E92EC|nr:PAS domain S-box protein [Pseudocnuella soli]
MSSNIPVHIDPLQQSHSHAGPPANLGQGLVVPAQDGGADNPVLAFFAGLPLPAFIYDPETLRIIQVNPKAPQHYGYTETEFLGRLVTDFHTEQEHDTVRAQIAQSRKGNTMTVRNWQHLRKDGAVLDVEVWASNIELDGRHYRMAIMNDITGKRQIETALRKSNERFELAAKASKDAIYEWNPITNELLWTTGLTMLFGWQPEEVTFNRWHALVHPDDVDETDQTLKEAIADPTQEIWSHDYRFRHQDGGWRDVQERCFIIRNEQGVATRCIGVLQDISEQKRLEQALLKKELERQKIIGQATIDSQEKERAEIGKELHDNVNQILTTTKLYLDLAQSNAELRDDLLQKASANVMHVINEIRFLSRSLADPSIGDLGLVDSINNLVADIQKSRQLEVRLTIDGDPDTALERAKKLMVFRIVQEALNNVVRHAQATVATVYIGQEGNIFKVVIQDDGVGVASKELVYGAGLNDIKNRVYLVDGNFQIESAAQKGVRLSISFLI